MSLSRNAILVSRGVLIIAMCIITYLAMTQLHLPVVDDLPDPLSRSLAFYILHILAFYILALSFDFAFPVKTPMLVKLVLLLGYGFGIEVFQGQFTERTFSMVDLLADVIGVMLYLASIPILKHLPWLRYRWNR
ncbi:MAG: VanZ family protein [Gammaproteobacteria bacterium]|nr:VanZ family protein [Gammaproteobacteria bacterium]